MGNNTISHKLCKYLFGIFFPGRIGYDGRKIILFLLLLILCLQAGAALQATPTADARPPIQIGETLDISKQMWYARHISVIGKKNAHAEEIRITKFPVSLNQIFQISPGSGQHEYVMRTRFFLSDEARDRALGLLLPGIGDNWEAYLNDHLIRQELALDRKGRIVRRRTVLGALIEFPTNVLRPGMNELRLRMIGDAPLTTWEMDAVPGLFYDSGYLIGPLRELQASNYSFLNMGLIVTYFLVGAFHVLLFIRLPSEKYNMIFAALCFIVFGFFLSRTPYLYAMIADTQILNRIENIMLFAIGPAFFLFFHCYFFPNDKPSLAIRYVLVSGIFMILLYSFLPFSYLATTGLVWRYLTEPLIIVYSPYFIYKAARKNFHQARGLLAGFVLFFLSIFGDIINQNFHLVSIEPTFRLGFFSLVVSMAIAIINRFINFYFETNRLNSELIRMDRIKDDFLASASHELRTPLQGIIGLSSRLLEKSPELTPLVRENLELIASGGRKMRRLVLDLLDFSRLKNMELKIHPTAVPLRPLTQVALRSMEPLLGNRPLVLRNEVSPDIPLVFADETRLLQIISNLLDNAIKYTRSGEIVVTATSAGERIVIEVRDTGCGMDLRILEQIFEPYQQGGNVVGGAGIGLSVVRHLVSLQDGKVWVVSEPGKGSRFFIDLPAAIGHATDTEYPLKRSGFEADSVLARIAQPEYPEIENARARILLVDDDPTILRLMGDLLTDQSYSVQTAMDGESALETLAKENFDMILLDLMLPGKSGLEVCREIRNRFTAGELPVVVITARDRREDLLESLSAGATDYLSKPFENQDLLLRVRHAIRLRGLYRARRSSHKKAREAADAEKGRIYRDLHDLLGSKLSDMVLQINALAKSGADQSIVLEMRRNIRGATRALRNRLDHMEDLQMLAHDFLSGLQMILIRRYAQAERILQFSYDTGSEARLREIYGSEDGRNLYAILYEVATNDLKYGRGESRWNYIFEEGGIQISMQAESNYQKTTPVRAGHGSRNIAARMAELGARYSIRFDENRFTLEMNLFAVR